ncbi:serendipity locus protein alpha-like isoform X3 [Ischnura elegans]|uniref:serendipity locus protein alpha-like isoform X3 n=1 Tax=Ischnura elegans TaxID=197161 RepID=UPI001ED899D2|nr:serendipity locus protein alpha-like isoform X3 [Ischnura elegans]
MDNGENCKIKTLMEIARPLTEQVALINGFNLCTEDKQVIEKLVDLPLAEVCSNLFQEEILDHSSDSKTAAFEALETITTAMDNLAEVLNQKQVESIDAVNVKSHVVSFLSALCDALTLSQNLEKENCDSLFVKCLAHLATLEDSASHHEALTDFKDLLSNLTNCFAAMKCKIPYLEGSSRKNAVQLYILQIRMCLPLFLQILKAKQADKGTRNHSLSESEQYVLRRINHCLLELRANVEESGGGSEEEEEACGQGRRRHHHRELVETACGQFVVLVDEALSTLATPMTTQCDKSTMQSSAMEDKKLVDSELIDVLSPKVEKILCLSMSVSHVAVSSKDAEAIVSCGQEVLRELQSLKDAFDTPDGKSYEINLHASNLSECLFCLEQKVNTALLRLVVEVFGDPFASLLQLMEASCRSEGPRETRCPEDLEDLIATYDLHMDRMVQIGMFAISCSNDRKRIPRVRSCLASLESLEPELVPTAVSLYLNPSSASKASHMRFLAAHWRQEVSQLQYLLDGIVDPVAFCRVTYDEVRKLIIRLRKCTWKQSNEDEAALVARIISRAHRTMCVLRQEGSDFLKKHSILISDLEFRINERSAYRIGERSVVLANLIGEGGDTEEATEGEGPPVG